MADAMVLKTQNWLNDTYGSNPSFEPVIADGNTGWNTIYGLIRALQIELGITATANNFGPGTQSRFKTKYPNGINESVLSQTPTSNVYSIIQGALWCKGYPAVYGKDVTKDFTEGMKSSIKAMKKDMGIGGEWTIDLEIMMALLSMKQFKLLGAYGGKESIRSIQQTINRSYRGYTGIVPTDGLYGREMNTAMIQVLQKIEGYTPSQATGYFGNGTKSNLRTISSGTSEWVWLANAALICNGYAAPLSDSWTNDTYQAVHKFQVDYALPVTHVVDTNTWMSLLTSKGNPDRPCIACDTRFEITDELANRLLADGYKIVGRYLSEPGQESKKESDYFKALRTGELERIVSHGLRYFPIFQEYSTRLEHFSFSNGEQHAKKALAAAKRLGVPQTIIYFAVDYDATDPEVTSNIIPYFKAVSENMENGYSVGIYASRNICTRVINAGYAEAAFVSDMSTGYSGNLGFPIPDAWVFDQFHEISGYGGKWDLDRVAYSGKRQAVPAINIVSSDDSFTQWVQGVEDATIAQFSEPIHELELRQSIIETIRKPEYWSDGLLSPILWKVYTPEFASNVRTIVENNSEGLINIKKDLRSKNEDIAHMAATYLGYMNQGFESAPNEASLGDFGGWALDLVQIWGSYIKSNENLSLKEFANLYIGAKASSDINSPFSYNDMIADADGYLLAKEYWLDNGRLSSNLRVLRKYTFSQRIKFFYFSRFNGNVDNVKKAFRHVLFSENIIEQLFKRGAIAAAVYDFINTLPSAEQADILSEVFANKLQG